MGFERNRDEDHGDMAENTTCVTSLWSNFMNKKLLVFMPTRKTIEKSQYVDEIIIIESPCNSIEELV